MRERLQPGVDQSDREQRQRLEQLQAELASVRRALAGAQDEATVALSQLQAELARSQARRAAAQAQVDELTAERERAIRRCDLAQGRFNVKEEERRVLARGASRRGWERLETPAQRFLPTLAAGAVLLAGLAMLFAFWRYG
jgi:septal ring factor EnvC (AmiA/AmiB activator)